MNIRQVFVAAAVIGAGALLTWVADGATLKVGDPAPKLQTGKWVQGEPVKAFEKGNAYIVEFWATWCGPCRVSIPHLNEIYNKFKDKKLIVIGQDCWEKDESLVEPFIKKMGDKMTYRVALDDKEGDKTGKMAVTWMQAAGQNGIPSAFLVNTEGKIAWIGHPMEMKEETIEQVLEGKYDLQKATAEAEKRTAAQGQLQDLSRQFGAAMQAKDWDKAESTLAEVEKLLPEEQRSGTSSAHLQILLGKEDFKGAAKLAGEIADANPKNAMMQNQFAWTLLTHPGIKEPDLPTAERLAMRANDLLEGKDPAVLDTLALVRFKQGKKDQALELQQKAVSLADGDMKASLQKRLDSYKEGKEPAGE